MKRKKTLVIATLVVAGLIIGGSTFAWFTSEDSVVNTLKTGTFKTTVTETFDPPTNWEPGQKVIKQAAVTNVGSTDALVKVQLTQQLILKTESTSNTSGEAKIVSEAVRNKFSANVYSKNNTSGVYKSEDVSYGDSKTAVVFQKERGGGAYELYAYDSTSYQELAIEGLSKSGGAYVYDGTMSGLGSYLKPVYLVRNEQTEVVYDRTNYDQFVLNFSSNKVLIDSNIDSNTDLSNYDWVFNPDDKCFYYLRVVKPGETTPNLLESVELKRGADNTYQNAEFKLTVQQWGIQAFTADSGSTTYTGSIKEFVGDNNASNNDTIESIIESKLAALEKIHTEGETYTGETATVEGTTKTDNTSSGGES